MEAILSFRNVTFAYESGVKVLDDVSFDMVPLEKVALIGPNGAGKSTLLLHTNGLLRGTGEVVVQGEPVTRKNLQSIRRKVGLVFQNPDDQLFSPSIYDDLAFGPLNLGMAKEAIPQAVQATAESLGLASLIQRPPHHLSFGERKRAAIGTVLTYNPPILVFDEPSSNLDPKNRRELITILQSLDRTMLIATHDLDMAWEVCDRCVLLSAGKVAADGDTEQILSHAALLQQHNLELPFRLQQR